MYLYGDVSKCALRLTGPTPLCCNSSERLGVVDISTNVKMSWGEVDVLSSPHRYILPFRLPFMFSRSIRCVPNLYRVRTYPRSKNSH